MSVFAQIVLGFQRFITLGGLDWFRGGKSPLNKIFFEKFLVNLVLHDGLQFATKPSVWEKSERQQTPPQIEC